MLESWSDLEQKRLKSDGRKEVNLFGQTIVILRPLIAKNKRFPFVLQSLFKRFGLKSDVG